ncbi:ABC transporter permease subunit [candidate division KSB3 bacterium]|uniref:ABC transporter permease subunit n=1 Tax=candidate division KSB3 bacterium TaxID=2044937 RepID=A0A9D5Q7B8_9BACT|nr:ABC transporter permease subunit [candidate division KSB3 bacterium]MBD3325711.1 ABC transporter permease subunit [candidate division KSB3 bacterium]
MSSYVTLQKKRRSTFLYLLLPAVLVLVVITIFPFIYSVVISLTGMEIARPQRGMPFVGLDNYIELANSERFWNSVKVTFIFVFSAVIIEFLLGFGLAYLLKEDFWGRKVVIAFFIAPMVIPPIVSGLNWRFMYDDTIGLINYLISFVGISRQSWLGSPNLALPSVIVTDIWQWTPFLMLIILAGFHALPNEPFEAAKVDGASNWQTLRYVTLPMLKQVISVGILIRIIELFRTFDTIYIMTEGGPGVVTETMSIRSYLLGFRFFSTARACAFSLVMLFLIIVVCTKFFNTIQGGEEGYA